MENDLSQNQEDVLLALSRDDRRAYKPKEILEVVDFTRRTVHNNLEQLIEDALVKKITHGKYKLTEDGQEALEEIEEPVALVEPEVQNKRIKGLEEKLPSGPHVASFELALSVIYAKQNLFNDYDKGWPGLVLFGPTKTYKTGLGEDILKVIGIEPTEAVKNLETAAPGEVGVRHRKAEGGGYTAETSYVLEYPAFVFDELDEAGSKIEDKVKVYLQSESSDIVEGEKIDLQMVPIVTLNAEKIEEILPDQFIRRSFLMDTSKLGIQEDIDLQAPEIKKYLKQPLCNPQRPKKIEFPEGLPKLVRSLYRPFVKDDFWRNQGDLRPIVIALKGRMLSPLSSGDPQRDLVDSNFRVLQLAATRGKTVNNWRPKFAEKVKDFTGSEELQEAFAKKEKKAQEREREIQEQKREQEERKAKVDEEKVQKAVKKYTFDLDKGKITAELEGLHDALYPLKSQKANRDTRPARDMLDDLLQDLEKVSSREELEVFAKAFQEVKQKPKFIKGVKVAILCRSYSSNDLKVDVANWSYFIDEKEIEKMKEQARKVSGKSEKQTPEDTQTGISKPKDQTQKSVPSIPPELQRSRQKKQKSEKPPLEAIPETPPLPEKQGFFTELANFVIPGRRDHRSRVEKQKERRRDARLKEVKKRNRQLKEEQEEKNQKNRSLHGTPADQL